MAFLRVQAEETALDEKCSGRNPAGIVSSLLHTRGAPKPSPFEVPQRAVSAPSARTRGGARRSRRRFEG